MLIPAENLTLREDDQILLLTEDNDVLEEARKLLTPGRGDS